MEKIDILQNRNKIFQDTEDFQFGIDAVLLSYFAQSKLKKDSSLVDLCSGNSIIPLLLEKKIITGKIIGIEIQTKSAELAQKSILENNLTEKIQILNQDLKNVPKLIKKNSIDFVTCNPPYMIFEHGKQNATDSKAIARHEISCTLRDIISATDYLLKTHGTFFLIHRPFRLPEIFTTLKEFRLEPKKMQLVYPFIDKEPNLVLIEATKNANPRLQNEKPLIVRNKNREYTAQIQEIYDSLALS